MTLLPGTTLTHYEIIGQLGAGAMGEVYRAKDSRLGREVAIKVLPEHFATDADRLKRFDREAQTLASLNHPNVAQIFGVDQVGDTCFLVLELVEGESLEERLKRGPLPLDEALDVCRQIAEGLEAAHEAGVIHRDLKPANVRITPDGKVKLLDFGLAKPAVQGAEGPTSADSVLSTEAGRLLGTPTYMAPEQARGRPIDRRVDIWAFGCVLYECLTARRAFAGETLTDVFAAVIEREPDWTRLPTATPAGVRELLRRCFQKDSRSRLRDIGEARVLLANPGRAAALSAAARTGRPVREAVAWSAAALALAAAAWTWSGRASGPAGVERAPLRFQITAPEGASIDGQGPSVALSPDGRSVAFIAAEAGQPPRLWVRDLDTHRARALEGTEGALMPFWAPTSDALGYFAKGRLLRIALSGSAPVPLADAPAPRGGDWSEDGTILFAPLSTGPLHAVPAAGGTDVVALPLDASRGERGQRFPQFLPGGRAFLYAGLPAEDPNQEMTCIGTLDPPASRKLLLADSRATFAPPDWLLIDREGRVFAQRLDPSSGALEGAPVPTGIACDGVVDYGGAPTLTCSSTGAVAAILDGDRRGRLVRLDGSGAIVARYSLPPDTYEDVAIAPDGQHAVVMAGTRRKALLLVDLARDGVWERFAPGADAMNPVWSPDGAWLWFTLDRISRDLYRAPASGGGAAELMLESGNAWAGSRSFSPDGRILVLNQQDPRNGRDLWTFDAETRKAAPWKNGPESEFDAAFSPDGRFVAFASTADGRPELYVEDWPAARVRARVSEKGVLSFMRSNPSATLIHWAPDGSELVFVSHDGLELIATPVTLGDAIKVGRPRTLCGLPPDTSWVEVSDDGATILAIVPDDRQAAISIAVTLGWERELAPRGAVR